MSGFNQDGGGPGGLKTISLAPLSLISNPTGQVKPVNLLSPTGNTGPTGAYPVVIQASANDNNPAYPEYAAVGPIDGPLVPGIPTKILRDGMQFSPTIDMDFVNQRYIGPIGASGLQCLRASSGYAFDTSGNAILFPANTPRITNKGWLVENGSVTNLVLWSQAHGVTGWTGSTGTIAGATGPVQAPDGSMNGFPFYDNTTNAQHSLSPTTAPAVTAGTTYTWSGYVRAGIQQNPQFSLQSSPATSSINATMSLTGAGSVGATSVAGAAGQTGIFYNARCQFIGPTGPSPWYLCEVTGALGTGTTSNPLVQTNGGASYSGTGAQPCFYIWQSQLEANYYASTPIATDNAARTRLADACTLTGPFQSPAGAVSLYASYIPMSALIGSNQSIWAVSDGSSSNRDLIFRASTKQTIGLNAIGGVTVQIGGTADGDPPGILYKVALSANSSLLTMRENSPVVGATGAVTGVAANMTSLQVGMNGGFAGQPGAYIQRVALWSGTALNENQLKQLVSNTSST